MRAARWLFITLLALLLAACNTATVRPSATGPRAAHHKPMPAPLAEHLLLDVGVDVLDPGIEHLDPREPNSTPGIRRAEGNYMATTLAQTLQRTGQWGAVRVVPQGQTETDLRVSGQIIESTGDTLVLRIVATDSRGQQWLSRRYQHTVGRFDHDKAPGDTRDVFQPLYDQIARDLIDRLHDAEPAELTTVRTTTKLRFAQRFAPDAFGNHLEHDSRGNYKIKHLPAANDPAMAAIDRIRVRDQMFIDRLQSYYRDFTTHMRQPYDQWRRESYVEALRLKQIKSEATARKIGGALAILAGILAQGSSSSITRSAGVVGIGAGAYIFKSGIDRGAEASIHAAALREMSESLNAEITPHTMTLADRSVTLTGTVEEQYVQWRALLREIYLTETGQGSEFAVPPDAAAY